MKTVFRSASLMAAFACGEHTLLKQAIAQHAAGAAKK